MAIFSVLYNDRFLHSLYFFDIFTVYIKMWKEKDSQIPTT